MMFVIMFTIVSISNTIMSSNATILTWNQPLSMNHPGHFMAVIGYNAVNGEIAILGGKNNGWTEQQAISSYSVQDQTWSRWTDLPFTSSTTPRGIEAWQQNYAQINDIIYIWDWYDRSMVHTYNMTSHIWLTNTFTSPVSGSSNPYCLTSYKSRYLFFLWPTNKDIFNVRIYDLHITNYTTSQVMRFNVSGTTAAPTQFTNAAIADNWLYIMGERSNLIVNRIYVGNISYFENEIWQGHIPLNFDPGYSARPVVFGDDIYFIGSPANVNTSNVQIINASTVITSTSYKTGSAARMMAIIAAARIYVFGGEGTNGKWWSSNFLTVEPTTDPTQQPTYYPTKIPTVEPTYYPSNTPTRAPTYYFYSLDVTFKYKLVFEENINTSFIDDCVEHFGDIQSTQLSLNAIDEIVGTSLSLYVSFGDIHSIEKDPKTILQSEELFSDCLQNFIKLTTSFQVTIQNNTQQEKLFVKNSFFFNQTINLLVNYFGILDVKLLTVIVNRTQIILIDIDKQTISMWTDITLWCFIGSIFCVICILITCILLYCKKIKHDMEKLCTYFQNPMVLTIGIGHYDHPEFSDLNVDIDIRNLAMLFKGVLKYQMYPRFNSRHIKLKWDQKELILFLFQKAKQFNESDHDGLIVVLTGHGIQDYIITSDGRAIEKAAIHRIFTHYFPLNRNKPRLFIFDSCNSLNDEDNIDDNDDILNTAIKLHFINKLNEAWEAWTQGQPNPDWKLCTLSASNPGYSSKMHLVTGSYLITQFVQRMIVNINENNKYFLFNILDKIQSDLHKNGKQLTVNILNEHTRYIKFVPNEQELKDDNNEELNENIIENSLEEMLANYVPSGTNNHEAQLNGNPAQIEMQPAHQLEYQQTNDDSNDDT
eukprot:108587_1